MENKKRYTITISPKIVRKAKIFAIENDTNFSALVEKALVELMKKENKNENS